VDPLAFLLPRRPGALRVNSASTSWLPGAPRLIRQTAAGNRKRPSRWLWETESLPLRGSTPVRRRTSNGRSSTSSRWASAARSSRQVHSPLSVATRGRSRRSPSPRAAQRLNAGEPLHQRGSASVTLVESGGDNGDARCAVRPRGRPASRREASRPPKPGESRSAHSKPSVHQGAGDAEGNCFPGRRGTRRGRARRGPARTSRAHRGARRSGRRGSRTPSRKFRGPPGRLRRRAERRRSPASACPGLRRRPCRTEGPRRRFERAVPPSK